MGEGLRRIAGYELERVLAAGGMGVVHVAREVETGRQVALKLLLELRGEVSAKRFTEEAQNAARLRHPHIVPVHAAGEHEGAPWFVMELVEGESLGARVDRDGPLEPREAARIAAELAEALAFAHAQQVLHRDVKPANVLLGPGDAALLTDFGLSKALSDTRERLTLTGQMLGTPAFMPPEQAVGEPGGIGPRSDVYGVGATLYAALTGRPPFEGATLLELIAALTRGTLLPPRALRPEVPLELDLVVQHALAREPDDRYPSAAALAEDLRRFLAGEPVRARPASRAVRFERWARRHLAALAIAAVGSVLLAAAVVGARVVGERRRAATAWAQRADAARAAGDAAAAAARAWLWSLTEEGPTGSPPRAQLGEASAGLEQVGPHPGGELRVELERLRDELARLEAALDVAAALRSGRPDPAAAAALPEGPARALLLALHALRAGGPDVVAAVEPHARGLPEGPAAAVRLRAATLALEQGTPEPAERLLGPRSADEPPATRRLRARVAAHRAVAAVKAGRSGTALKQLRAAKEADPAELKPAVAAVAAAALARWKGGARLSAVLVLLDGVIRAFGTAGVPAAAADAYLQGSKEALAREDYRAVERCLRQGRRIARERMQAAPVLNELLAASCRLLREGRGREGFEVLLLSLRSGAGMGAFEAVTTSVGVYRIRKWILEGIHEQAVREDPDDWAARVVRMSIHLNFRAVWPQGQRAGLRRRCREDADWLLARRDRLPPELQKSTEHGELLLRLQEERYVDAVTGCEALLKRGYPDPHVLLQLAYQAARRAKLPSAKRLELARRWVAAVEQRREQVRTNTVPADAGGAGIFGNASLKPESPYVSLIMALVEAKQVDEAAKTLEVLKTKQPDERLLLVARAIVHLGREEWTESKKCLDQAISGLPFLPPVLRALRDRIRASIPEDQRGKPAPEPKVPPPR